MARETQEAEDTRPLGLAQVLAEELRKTKGIYTSYESLDDVFEKQHEAELTALCFSGGGIRSATFGLGIVQALAKQGLLSKFDYLSTVSGGGYLGTWLSAWVCREHQHRTNLDDRIEQARWSDDLLDHFALRFVQFVRPRRRRYVDRLTGTGLEFLKVQRPVILCTRKPKPVLNERALSRLIALIHRPKLRDRLMGLIDDHKGVVRQVIEQRRWRCPGRFAR